jgi:hypothetical protein
MVDFLISYKNNFAKISRGRSRITSENGNYVVDSENITFKLRSSTTTTTTAAPTTTTTTTTTSAPSEDGLLISNSYGQDGVFCPVATYNGKLFYKHVSLSWFIWHDGLDWFYGDAIGGGSAYNPADPTSIVGDLRYTDSNYSNSPTPPLSGWSSDLSNAIITQTTCVF